MICYRVREAFLCNRKLRSYYTKNAPRANSKADIEKTEFSPTDIILLCSDGLTNMLEDSEIESVFETVPAERVCDELVSRALKNGGTDNVTAVIVCGDEIE